MNSGARFKKVEVEMEDQETLKNTLKARYGICLITTRVSYAYMFVKIVKSKIDVIMCDVSLCAG